LDLTLSDFFEIWLIISITEDKLKSKFSDFYELYFSSYSTLKTAKKSFFASRAVTKKIITIVTITLEGWDRYQIVAYIVGFHMMCNMPISEKIFISRSYKIFLKFECFKKLPF
jgi:hypothetical protein